jgi:predicted nucleotidyltransferase
MGMDIVKDVQEKVVPYLKEKYVHKAIMFGSAARGTNTRHSDIDLLLVVDTDKRWLKRFEDYIALYQMFPKSHLELFIYTPEEMRRMSHRVFMRTIMNEGVVIYESGKESV